MRELSVVIPNWNGMAYLKACLDSLENQSFQNFEILMVDNGSEDGSTVFVREHYPQVRILELDRNYGFCRAVNLGIRAAKTPYIVLLNNDVEADRECLSELLRGIKKQPSCFSCAAKMIRMDDRERMDDGGDYYCALGWAFALGKDGPVDAYNEEREIFASCAGAAIYRREVFEEIGMFDEKHFAYLEDIDMGYRAKIYGYRNWYLPGAKVYHAGSGSSGSRYNEFKVRLSSRNNVYLIYKNMPFLQILLNSPFLFAGFLAKALFFARQGYALIYLKGLAKGVGMAIQGRKVAFRREHLKNYAKIQWELWVNMFRRIGWR